MAGASWFGGADNRRDGVRWTMLRFLVGRPATLPGAILEKYPELQSAAYRMGGLPPRVAGWFLGQRSVAAITLWRTVWLADTGQFDTELLLHELRHVAQFESSRAFPILYLWESLRRGYHDNRYEVDARRYAAARLRGEGESNPATD
jgi:hypothetical protein